MTKQEQVSPKGPQVQNLNQQFTQHLGYPFQGIVLSALMPGEKGLKERDCFGLNPLLL